MRFVNLKLGAAVTLVALVASFGLLGFSKDTQAAPAGRVDVRVPYVDIIPSACTGEPVFVVGRAHLHGQLHVNDNGAAGHLLLRVGAFGRGLVSESPYVLVGGSRVGFVANGEGGFVGRVNLRAHLIALGEGMPHDDGTLRIRGQVTVNAEGEVVSSSLAVGASCR